MKILLLGGPKFLGRHLLDAGLERGHTLTMFNRGQTNPELYHDVEKLRGNRDGDLEALRGKQWDGVIDTCGYLPRLVSASAELLKDAAGYYTFISSISVYASFRETGMDESTAVGTLEDESIEEVTNDSYGPLKALCEQAVEQAFPSRALHVRAGLIVGPYDPTDRFTYWPVRVRRGGEILAPGKPDSPVQLVDGRDLAHWIFQMVESGKSGVYNTTGPAQPLQMSELLETCRSVSGSPARFTWLPEEFLLEQEVSPWIQMPLWVPESDPEFAGFSTVDCSKAIGEGLRFRPLEETVQATLDWASARSEDWQWRAGLDPSREAEVLQAWHAREDPR